MYTNDDQPIDLTKHKYNKPKASLLLQSSTPVPQKHALSDIADMVKVLPKATTPKPSMPARVHAMKLETDVRRFEDVSSEMYSVHKRKGRQSNWNPQHLLILQAQFASSLFLTSEGKYLLSDLGPQERMHISKFTGLSMTTISHWLANVKYQLRKTGGTKFLKNMDTGYPVFYCNDCASQFRTPSAFISHLENHLGFQIKDMNKLPIEHPTKVTEPELSRRSMSGRRIRRSQRRNLTQSSNASFAVGHLPAITQSNFTWVKLTVNPPRIIHSLWKWTKSSFVDLYYL